MKYLGTLIAMFICSIAAAGQPAAYAGGCRGYAIGYAAPQIQFAPVTQYRPITTFEPRTELRPVVRYEEVTTQVPVTRLEPYTVNVPIAQCAPTVAYAPPLERERLLDRVRSNYSRTTINIDRERVRERSSLLRRERGGCGSYGVEASTAEPPVLIPPIQ